jgi:hypothetical protein
VAKGELEHRRVKRFYGRTNKQRFVGQIAKHQRRERLLQRIKQRLADKKSSEAGLPVEQPGMGQRGYQDTDELSYTNPEAHYHISASEKDFENVASLLSKNKHERPLQVGSSKFPVSWPYLTLLKNFLPNLKMHLLSRIKGDAYTGEELQYSDADRDSIKLKHHRIYRHQVIRINYTTYDMRRCQDSINAGRPDHANVMVLAHEDDPNDPHPYWYARILGIFHAHVSYRGGQPQKMEFLFVRWYGRDLSHRAGWTARRLHRIGFLTDDDADAYGFLDPNDIVRAIHLIPAFALGDHGDVNMPIGLSSARSYRDWVYFYVNL